MVLSYKTALSPYMARLLYLINLWYNLCFLLNFLDGNDYNCLGSISKAFDKRKPGSRKSNQMLKLDPELRKYL